MSEDNKEEITEEYICPITHEPFIQPVYLVDDGFTYEEDALIKWGQTGHDHTPMGFPYTEKTYFENLAVKYKTKICRFTKEEWKDPVIVNGDFHTYENDALVKYIEQSWCKYKPIGLIGGSFTTIEAYPNKILWKGDVERKPFVMPKRKVYPLFDRNKLVLDSPDKKSHVKIDPVNLMRDEPYIGVHFNGVRFVTGCFKMMKFINCYFYRCVISNCCHCSSFKSCKFETCTFISINLRTYRCPGTDFINCRYLKDNEKDENDINNLFSSYGANKTEFTTVNEMEQKDIIKLITEIVSY